MSIRALNRVWEHSVAKGYDLLVALALADYADERGRSWPSVQTLMRKSRMSDREVQRCLKRLHELKDINIYPNAGPRGVNVYQTLCFGDTTTPAQCAPPTIGRGDRSEPATAPTPQADLPVEQAVTPVPPTNGRGDNKVENPTVLSPKPPRTIKNEPPGEPSCPEIPSEAEVQEEGKRYPGNVVLGTPAEMPMPWCSMWYSGKLGFRSFNWDHWRRVMKLDFEQDFRDNRKHARDGLAKNGAGGGAGRRPAWQVAQDLAALDLKIEQHPRTNWPGNVPLPDEVRKSYDELLRKRAELKNEAAADSEMKEAYVKK